jgi:hypothetical protein
MTKVRKGKTYIFRINGWDLFDRKPYMPENGTQVRVCAPHGCPPPNTMGHAYIETLDGRFLGLVSTASLQPIPLNPLTVPKARYGRRP